MISKRFLIVRFPDDGPAWEEFDGRALKPAPAPGERSRLPILALLPDKYFFFYQPEGLTLRNERQLRAAALLQMNQLFPARGEGQERGAMRVGETMLGYVSHPGLAEFLKIHRAILDRASVISTSFIAALSAAQSAKLPAWSWRDGSGPTALYAGDRLYYLNGNGKDLEARLSALEMDAPPELTLEMVLSETVRSRSSWAKLRLPLTLYAESEADAKPFMRAVATAVVVGLLFCAGQYMRLSRVSAEAAAAQASLREMYGKALGAKAGNDPYGQLLFRLSQLKGSQSKGVDVLDVLEVMSRAAEGGGLRLESLSLTSESGAARGRIDGYNQLEAYMKALAEQDGGYSFTLEQATNASDGVQFGLRVGL